MTARPGRAWVIWFAVVLTTCSLLVSSVDTTDVPVDFFPVTYPSPAEFKWVSTGSATPSLFGSASLADSFGISNVSSVSDGLSAAFNLVWLYFDASFSSAKYDIAKQYLNNYRFSNGSLPSARGLVSNLEACRAAAETGGIGLADFHSTSKIDANKQLFPLGERNPFTCGFADSGFFWEEDCRLVTNACASCQSSDWEETSAQSVNAIVYLEHGNPNGLEPPSLWPGRALMHPLREDSKPPLSADGRAHFSRALHWTGDSNDAPRILAETFVLDEFVVGMGTLSMVANVSQILSRLDYIDEDRGRGYCVYPGLVITNVVAPSGSWWQYRRQTVAISDNWFNISTNLSERNAFTLGGMHQIRLLTSINAVSGQAKLVIAGWDGTTVENPGADKLEAYLNITERRGHEYATSQNSSTVVVHLLGGTTTATSGSNLTTGDTTTGEEVGNSNIPSSGKTATATGSSEISTASTTGRHDASSTATDDNGSIPVATSTFELVHSSSTSTLAESYLLVIVGAALASLLLLLGIVSFIVVSLRRRRASMKAPASLPNVQAEEQSGEIVYHTVTTERFPDQQDDHGSGIYMSLGDVTNADTAEDEIIYNTLPQSLVERIDSDEDFDEAITTE